MLQDSACPLMEQLTFFHDHTLLILVIITILVSQMLVSMLFNKFIHRYLLEGQLIETIWTILPAVVLVFIALPSLRLLYILDETHNPMITIKSIAHQWYWSYEYSDYKKIELDSYMLPTTDLSKSSFRLLDVNNRMVIPFNTQIRMLVTSADVIHSWTVPALGVKIDGTPGRLNQANFNINRTGLYYGQCSEICGANHSFMPIVIESIAPTDFLKWINSAN
uniref:Cytochrome c oxidase subunit 2 n=1 Tax=Gnathotrichus materiarius TaxID=1220286 RepID=A0A343A6M5_9CUCU|nr:cytochrome c oxidase subunit II [Gnathotrichus materiarius]AOY40230.1 cytochrome c oxidase subunit 2 [Gnathotrichus materiarius]